MFHDHSCLMFHTPCGGPKWGTEIGPKTGPDRHRTESPLKGGDFGPGEYRSAPISVRSFEVAP